MSPSRRYCASRGALDVTRTQLIGLQGAEDEPWRAAATSEVANAQAWLDEFKLEAAWSALKSAHREMVRSYDPSQLVAEARALRNEADAKLTGWRKKSVAGLLPGEFLVAVGRATGGLTVERTVTVRDTPVGPESPDAADRVPSPRRTMCRHRPSPRRVSWSRIYGRDLCAPRRWSTRTRTTCTTSSGSSDGSCSSCRRCSPPSLGLLAVIVALEWVPETLVADASESESPLISWRLLLVVMSLGIIGGFLSAATELRTGNEKLRIPELRVSYALLIMRPVIGAAGAVVLIVVLQSALAEAVNLAPTAVFGVAIAAGFTERFVTRTISSAARAVGS